MEKKTVAQAITDAMRTAGLSQKKLAEKMGLKAQQAVFNMLNAKNGMRSDNFIKALDLLGYDVIIRNRITNTEEQIIVNADNNE